MVKDKVWIRRGKDSGAKVWGLRLAIRGLGMKVVRIQGFMTESAGTGARSWDEAWVSRARLQG